MRPLARRRNLPAVAPACSPLACAPSPTGNALIAAATLEDSPVELGTFDLLVDWADAMAAGKDSYARTWNPDHPLVRFGELFWTDLCRAVYDWRGPALPHHDTAADLNVAHEHGTDRDALFSDELLGLMLHLEDWLAATRTTTYDPGEVRAPALADQRADLARLAALTCLACADWAAAVGLDDLHFEARRGADALRRTA